MSEQRPAIGAGSNVALKVPAHEHSRVVRFYRDVLGFEQIETRDTSVCFAFGTMRLWVDRCPQLSQAETWLELTTDDLESAHAWLREAGVDRCDSIEPLPDDFKGFWVMAPGNLVHLVTRD